MTALGVATLFGVPGLVLFFAGWTAALFTRLRSHRTASTGLRLSMVGFGLFVLGLWLGGAAFALLHGEVLPALASATIGLAITAAWAFVASRVTFPEEPVD